VHDPSTGDLRVRADEVPDAPLGVQRGVAVEVERGGGRRVQQGVVGAEGRERAAALLQR